MNKTVEEMFSFEKQYIIRTTKYPILGPVSEDGRKPVHCPLCSKVMTASRSTFVCNSDHKGVFNIGKRALSILDNNNLTKKPMTEQLFQFPLCNRCRKCTMHASIDSRFMSGGVPMYVCGCPQTDKIFIRLVKTGIDETAMIAFNFNEEKYDQYINSLNLQPNSKKVDGPIDSSVIDSLFE